MRNQLLLGLLLAAAPAAAQPITQPTACEVTISRAPDDVREAIEAWVKAEPRCSTTLDVRVVTTEGGFYLFARDGAGRVRERIVPDAQSAGVLVASWVADDLIAAAPPPPPAAPSPAHLPPSAVPVAAPAVEAAAVVATAAPRRASSRWIMLGATAQVDGLSAGLRGEVDVLRRGKWALGAILAGSYSSIAFGYEQNLAPGQLETVDVALLAALSRTSSIGKWGMRVSLAAGLARTRVTGYLAGEPMEAEAVVATAEASVLFTRSFHDSWAVAAGPIVTLPTQEYSFMDDQGARITFERRGVDLLVFGGIRRRL